MPLLNTRLTLQAFRAAVVSCSRVVAERVEESGGHEALAFLDCVVGVFGWVVPVVGVLAGVGHFVFEFFDQSVEGYGD